jgi:hypothetical protein
MEAFITRSNAERIVKKMDLNEVDVIEFRKQMKFKWFNMGELRKLKAYEMLFSDPDLFLSNYVALKPREDANDYVFKSNAAFHTSENCTKMLSDFKNFKIPENVIKSGRKQEFIQFCTEHAELYNNFPDQFRLRLRWKFNITFDPFVHFENSGYKAIENMTLLELEKAIENIIEDFNNWLRESSFNRQVIEKFGFQSFNYKNPEKIDQKKISNTLKKEDVIEVLKHFQLNIKEPLMELFTYYYRMKNNSDLSFESNILIELGFRQCSHCKANSLSNLTKRLLAMPHLKAG